MFIYQELKNQLLYAKYLTLCAAYTPWGIGGTDLRLLRSPYSPALHPTAGVAAGVAFRKAERLEEKERLAPFASLVDKSVQLCTVLSNLAYSPLMNS